MEKKFKDHADATAQRIFATLGVTPSPAQRAAVIEMLEQELVDNAVATRQWCVDHALKSKETGRTLAEEMQSAHDALIANLSSMR